MNVKKLLKRFYNEYYYWLADGSPAGVPFDNESGMCSALLSWVKTVDGGSLDDDTKNKILNLQHLQLRNRFGPGVLFPFGGYEAFVNDYQTKSPHLNPLRMAWVKEHTSGLAARHAAGKKGRGIWISLLDLLRIKHD